MSCRFGHARPRRERGACTGGGAPLTLGDGLSQSERTQGEPTGARARRPKRRELDSAARGIASAPRVNVIHTVVEGGPRWRSRFRACSRATLTSCEGFLWFLHSRDDRAAADVRNTKVALSSISSESPSFVRRSRSSSTHSFSRAPGVPARTLACVAPQGCIWPWPCAELANAATTSHINANKRRTVTRRNMRLVPAPCKRDCGDGARGHLPVEAMPVPGG